MSFLYVVYGSVIIAKKIAAERGNDKLNKIWCKDNPLEVLDLHGVPNVYELSVDYKGDVPVNVIR